MRIETLYNCLGYFGFGSGVQIAKNGPQQNGVPMYCNSCQFAKECWQLHRQRMQKLMPEVCAHIDELGKKPDGQKQIMEFIRQYKSEPYMAGMMANLDDGAHVACGMPPKDRGEKYTIKFPFPKMEDEQ